MREIHRSVKIIWLLLVTETMSNLTVQTDLKIADFRAFVRLIARQTVRRNRARRWVVATLAAAVLAMLIRLAFLASNTYLDVPSFAAGAVMMLLWYLIISRFRFFRLGPGENGITLGPRTIALEDNGIRQSSERHDSLYRWSAIKSVEVTDQHVFLMLDANAAMIVPFSAFVTFAERDKFVDEVKKRTMPEDSSGLHGVQN
jgi:hypothetical protein